MPSIAEILQGSGSNTGGEVNPLLALSSPGRNATDKSYQNPREFGGQATGYGPRGDMSLDQASNYYKSLGSTILMPGGNFISSGNAFGGKPQWQPPEDFNYNPYASGPMNKIVPGAQPNDLMFRGKTPGTGTPYFGNLAPEWAPEEVKQQFNQRKAEIDAANKPKAITSGEGINQADLAKHAQVVQLLTKGGYSPTAAATLADRVVPSIGNANKAAKHEEEKLKLKEKADVAREMRIQRTLGNYFNKQTGATAADEFLDAPPDMETIQKDYIPLDSKQKERYSNLQQLASCRTKSLHETGSSFKRLFIKSWRSSAYV